MNGESAGVMNFRFFRPSSSRPMFVAAFWTFYTDPDVAARRRRNAAVRKLRREGRLTRDAARSIKAGEWL